VGKITLGIVDDYGVQAGLVVSLLSNMVEPPVGRLSAGASCG
jgi:hypothetical protein